MNKEKSRSLSGRKELKSFPSLFVIFTFALVLGMIILFSGQNVPGFSIYQGVGKSDYVSRWKIYSNLTDNYSIKYPVKWQVSEGRDYQGSSAQNSTLILSPDFNWGSTPGKKIEKGYLVAIKVFPPGTLSGYSADLATFSDIKDIKIGKFKAQEYILKNIDESGNLPPGEIKFETKNNLIIIDGWFSSQNKTEFLDIFEKIAQTFKVR